MPLADLDRISKVPGLKVVTKGYEGLTYQLVVEINHRRKELTDMKVRQAIAHAIDRDFVVNTIFLGYVEPGEDGETDAVPGAGEPAGTEEPAGAEAPAEAEKPAE